MTDRGVKAKMEGTAAFARLSRAFARPDVYGSNESPKFLSRFNGLLSEALALMLRLMKAR